MSELELNHEIQHRRTFAIISHPDAGKTTITEKFLLYGKAIQQAGTVKGRGSDRHATSDWMAIEQQRGISVTTSVMQFPFEDCTINLLDTPGHEDFSEDTYRTLTAVDSALMVIDGSKGVEPRTIKLMEVCRLRTTPIVSFINKMDRDIREPIDLMDEIEAILSIRCAPMNWPIGMGKSFKGIYDLQADCAYLYKTGQGHRIQEELIIKGLDNPALDEAIGDLAKGLREELELVLGAAHPFDHRAFLAGELSPVYFGTALGNFGVKQCLQAITRYAPCPQGRSTTTREVEPIESNFSGFVFKIQANMDPRHRDRVAFLRICSGQYESGMKLKHVRLGKDIRLGDALTFLAGDRTNLDQAFPGDIIGLHNHGTIQIGDTFTQGEMLKFEGIPYFAPELFQRVQLKDPLKNKQLIKGLQQLSEEGATQVFMPKRNNDLIVGAVGSLQFDLVAFRLKNEYKVECAYQPIGLSTVRWVRSSNAKKLEEFKLKAFDHLGVDGSDHLVYLAPSMVNLQLTQERWPDIVFSATREV